MKENGLSTSFMVGAGSLMINLLSLMDSLIIQTLIIWIRNGSIMKEILFVIRSKEMVSLYSLMSSFIKDNLKMIKFKEKVDLLQKMDK